MSVTVSWTFSLKGQGPDAINALTQPDQVNLFGFSYVFPTEYYSAPHVVVKSLKL